MRIGLFPEVLMTMAGPRQTPCALGMRQNLLKIIAATCTFMCIAPGTGGAQETVKEVVCRSLGTFNVIDGAMLYGKSVSSWHLLYEDTRLVRILGPFACRAADKRMEILENTLILQCDQEFEGKRQTVLGRIDRRTGEFFNSANRGSEVLVSWGRCTSADGIF